MKLLLALSAFALSTSAVAATINKPAPAFTLQDESGKTHSLKDYGGKVVVLEWTNPKCPYVLHHYEAATMKTIVDKYKAQDVVWLAVDSSFDNTPAATKAWHAKWSMSYPTLQDPDGTVGKAYGALTTPHMYVIDQKGILRYAGAIDDDPSDSKKVKVNYTEKALAAVLAGKAPEPAETKAYGCSVKYKR